VSMLGGIQPDLLASYLGDGGHVRLQDDGLIQRFQLLVWPDTSAEWEYIDRPPDTEALARVNEIFQQIVCLDPDSPLRGQFSTDAQELFVTFMECLECRLRGGHSPA